MYLHVKSEINFKMYYHTCCSTFDLKLKTITKTYDLCMKTTSGQTRICCWTQTCRLVGELLKTPLGPTTGMFQRGPPSGSIPA